MQEILLVGLPGARFRWLHDRLQAQAAPVLRAAYHLDPAWAEALLGGQARGILLLDRPEAAFAELRQQGMAPVDALRTLAATAMPLGTLAGCAAVLLLNAQDCWDDADVMRRVFGHCGWPMPDALPAASGASEPPPLPAAEAALLDIMLRPALRHAMTGQLEPMVWPRDCLRWGDQPQAAAPRVIELTGWSRILVFGPYLPLPAGRWTMRTVLAFSPAARSARLTLDLRGGDLIGRCRFTVERPGLFAAVMAVTIASPHQPLELQLSLENGVIEGCLGIDRVEFTPAADQSVA